MTRSIQEPVRRDVGDEWHVPGSGCTVQTQAAVDSVRRVGNFLGEFVTVARSNATIFTRSETHAVISCWSIKYFLDNRVPAHTHPPAHCGKWIILFPVACYHKNHNTNIVVPYRFYESCCEFSYETWGLPLWCRVGCYIRLLMFRNCCKVSDEQFLRGLFLKFCPVTSS